MRISEATRAASFSGLFASESAREVLSRVPADVSAVRVLTAGAPGQGFASWIAAACERWTAATWLDVSVWACTDLDWMRAMVSRFGAGRVRLVMDSFVMQRHDGKRYRELVALLGEDAIRLGCVHAKVALLRGAGVVLCSSGNVERVSNRRVEQVSVDVDPVWAGEVGRWFDAAFENVSPGLEARPLWDRSLRHAFESVAAARAGEVEASAIPASAAALAAANAKNLPPGNLEGSGVPGASMRATLEAIHRTIDQRLAGVVSDSELVSLSRAAVAVHDRLGEIAGADLRLAGRVADVIEACIEPRSRAARRQVAVDGLARIREESEPV